MGDFCLFHYSLDLATLCDPGPSTKGTPRYYMTVAWSSYRLTNEVYSDFFSRLRALFQGPAKSVDSDTDSRWLYTLWCMHVGCGWEICNRVLKFGMQVCSMHVKVRFLGEGCHNHLTNSFIMNIPTVLWKWRYPVFLIVLPHQIVMSRWFLCSWRVKCASYLSDM